MTSSHPRLISPNGEIFYPVTEPLTKARAAELVAAGALIAIDPCGDGCTDVTWLTDRERKSALARGMTLSRRALGRFQQWQSPTGTVVVLVDGGDLRR
ncbi:hypothetical protein AB0H76_35040 [Nocardia sp. NPDC050712]|uniref:hypothetical protein n=1 Tax=Nocardia sp. NPDC050712 TaxID=3155518 RepID=UPI00340F5E72